MLAGSSLVHTADAAAGSARDARESAADFAVNARSHLWLAGVTAALLVALSASNAWAQGSSTPPTGESWSTRASLHIGRFAHAAVTLADGRVLVVGGQGPAGFSQHLASVEIYDPQTDSWREVALLVEARQVPSATLLPDGRVLVAGGFVFAGPLMSGDTDLTEIYDPVSDSWAIGPQIPVHGGNFRTVRLFDGRVLIAGGFSFGSQLRLDATQIYDPALNSWTLASPMASGRERHAIALLHDGRVLVAGGKTNAPNFSSLASAEVYQPATNSWSAIAPMPAGLSSATAATLTDGRV